MGELKLSDCVVYDGKIYCVKEDGKPVVFRIQEIEPDTFPPCVVEALFKKMLAKTGG
jgi:hypothetical protein